MTNNKLIDTEEVKRLLSVFHRAGIGGADRFYDVKSINHPNKYMADFKSVIVFAEGKQKSDTKSMGSFSDYMSTISAQSNVMDYLNSFGYKAVVIDNDKQDVSLVRMGIEAGLGEISPVNSLLIKGLGLTASLGAIITNAPLETDDKVSNICIKCNKCLHVCPIREIAHAKGNLDNCACGKCVGQCPV